MRDRCSCRSSLIWHDNGCKVVLVGQAPSRDTDGAAPFSGRSGRRLEELARLEAGELPKAFALANVLQRWPGASSSGKGDLFPAARARMAGRRLQKALAGRRVVALGRATAAALGAPCRASPMVWYDHDLLGALAMLPHPSGVNRWWNDVGHRLAGGMFLADLCAE